MSTQVKELPSESEGEELQRLRKVVPGLTEELNTQQRLVASLRDHLADVECKHKQAQQQLDAVNEELRVTKLHHALLQDQITSASYALSDTVIEQMRSDHKSQIRAFHSTIVQSVDRLVHDTIQSFRTATSTATSTHAGNSTLPQTLFASSLSPNRLNCRPNPDTSRYPEYPLTATITDSSPTPAHPTTPISVTSSPTRVAGQAHDDGDTFGGNEDTIC